MEGLKNLLKSKKFWLSIIGTVSMIVQGVSGMSIEPMLLSLLPIIGAIFGFAWQDKGKEAAKEGKK